MPLPAGTTPADGASWFVNPLTALGMTETMRREGHKALVHTAAASNLGQMLNKICIKDGIGLVNIVRSKEQADILHKIGAKHVVDSTAADLHGRSDQRAGGNRRHDRVRRHRRRQARGPDPHLHGDRGQQDRQGIQPLRLERAQAGLYLWQPRQPSDRIEPGVRHDLGRRRLAADAVPAEDRPGRNRPGCASAWLAELKTTFASHYTQVVSLQEALHLANIAVYNKRSTGEKYLINPNKGVMAARRFQQP